MNIPRWQIVDFGTLSSLIVTGWQRWRSGQRWRRFWFQMSGSVGRGCNCSFAPPTCLRINCSIVGPRKAFVCVVLTKHSQVLSYRSLHDSLPRNLNSQLPLLLDFGARFLDQILRFLYCSLRKPSCGHLGHIPRQVHVGLFQL